MTVNNYLRYSIFGGLALALFATPFIVSTSLFFPYISGKGFFFRFVVGVCFALWILLVARDRHYWPGRSQMLYAVLAFAGLLVLSTAFSVNPYKSFWSNFERMEGLVSYLHLFAYFIMLVSIMGSVGIEKRKRYWMILLHVSLSAFLFMTIQGLRQIIDPALNSSQSGMRVDGTFGNSAYMAVYMLIHIFLSLYYFVKSNVYWQKYCYSLLAFLGFIVLFYTQTRGAIGGAILGFALTLLIIAVMRGGDVRKWTISGLALIAILWGGLYLARDTDFVNSRPAFNRFADVNLTERTVFSRITIWGMAVEGIQERPILGYGLENFNLVFNKYYKPSLYQQEQWFDRAHNVFFDWLSAGGIIGLLTYLSLFAIALVIIWKRKEGNVAEKAVLTGLLAAYFIHNFFVFDNLISSILFFTLLAYLAGFDGEYLSARSANSQRSGRGDDARGSTSDAQRSGRGDRASNLENQASDMILRYVAGTVFFIAMFPIMYVVTIKPYQAGRYLTDAINPCAKAEVKAIRQSDGSTQYVCNEAREEAAKRVLLTFNKLFALDTFATGEAREQLIQTALQLGSNEQVSAEKRGALLELAYNQAIQMVADQPNDARQRLFLGMFYARLLIDNHLNLAIEQLESAVELTPNKPSMLLTLASLYAENDQYERAVAVARKAYDLETSNEEAGRVLFAIHLKYDKREDAIKVLEEMIENIPEFREKGEQFIADVKAGKNP